MLNQSTQYVQSLLYATTWNHLECLKMHPQRSQLSCTQTNNEPTSEHYKSPIVDVTTTFGSIHLA